MSIYKSISGMVEVSLISGDAAAALQALNASNITLFHSRMGADGLTIHFQLRRQDVKKLKELAKKKGYGVKLEGFVGLHWTIRRFLTRPILALCAAMLLTLSLYLPSRVLFVRVEGNQQVPTRLILEKCAQCGVGFGASRRYVRSEKVKNALIASIDSLQWVGVNTQGCVATVTVRERSQTEQVTKPKGVTSVVANMDGVILSCTATSGSLQCRVGQAVKVGDMLISGYTDCGISIRASRAEGEIFAQTRRDLQAVIPLEGVVLSETTATEEKYALIIGKNRINFYKGSGISGTTCDKIYEENYMTLPGGFQLPVAIVKETVTFYDGIQTSDREEDAQRRLSEFAAWYLPTRMTAGTVVLAGETVFFEDGLAILQGEYICCEMIGQIKNEEIITPYGNDQ